jgi:hypothetical protein
MTIDTDAAGFVQLAHPWFPSSEIRINGKPVTPIESAISLVVVPIPAGASTIEIGPTTTPIRRATTAISLVALLVVLGAWGIATLVPALRREPARA